MRIELHEIVVKEYTYDVDENRERIESTKQEVDGDTFTETHIYADEGKVFKRISTDEVLTAHIGVGSEDSVDDFEEIEVNS